MTRDYLRMKLEEKDKMTSVAARIGMYAFIGLVSMLKFESNAIFSHLNKRGVLTNYWVLNDDSEIDYVLQSSTVGGIMTDRPKHLARKLK